MSRDPNAPDWGGLGFGLLKAGGWLLKWTFVTVPSWMLNKAPFGTTVGAVLALIWLLTMGGVGIAAGGGAVGIGILLIPICMVLGMVVELATRASRG